MATTTTQLTITRLKGFADKARISGLNLTVLEKALALNGNVLVKEENNVPKFMIAFGKTSEVNNVSLTINKDDVKDNTLGVTVHGANPTATLVAASKYIQEIYTKAEELANIYDEVAKDIKEV